MSAVCKVPGTVLNLAGARWGPERSSHFSYANTMMASKWFILQPGINGAVDCPSPISSSSSSFLGPLSFPPCQRMRGQTASSTEAMSLLHGSLGEWAASAILDGQWNHLLGSEHEPEGWGIAPARQGPALLLVLPPTLPRSPSCLISPAHSRLNIFSLLICLQELSY